MKHRVTLAFILSPVLACASAQAKDTAPDRPDKGACIRLGGSETATAHFHAFNNLFTELYRRVGQCILSIQMGNKRIEMMRKDGALDGEWLRTDAFIRDRDLSDQILPQPVVMMTIRLVWLKGSRFDNSFPDLEGMVIGHGLGEEWFSLHIPKQGARAFTVTGRRQVPNLLIRNRIDAFASLGFVEREIRRHWPVETPAPVSADWETVPFYHLVSARHKDLIPELNIALTEMLQEGRVDSYLAGTDVLPAPVRTENSTVPFQNP